MRVAAEHGGGGVCKPSLVIRAVGRKVSLGAGEEGQHLLEDDSYLCVSHSHTLLHETQLCFTPFSRTSQTFSCASSDCEGCSEEQPFYVTAHFQIQSQMALNMFPKYEYESKAFLRFILVLFR